MPPHLANAASESAFVIGTGAEASHEISQLAIIEDEQPAAPNIVKPNPDLDCVKPYAAKDGIRRYVHLDIDWVFADTLQYGPANGQVINGQGQDE